MNRSCINTSYKFKLNEEGFSGEEKISELEGILLEVGI